MAEQPKIKETAPCVQIPAKPFDVAGEYDKLGWGKKGLDLMQCLPISRACGFNDFTIITQSWHESGEYRKVIGSFNYWGIKKPRNWTGKVLSIKTHEYINGTSTPVSASFIDFETCAEAVNWWISLIQRLYPEAYLVRNNPQQFFIELVNLHNRFQYATDNKYAEKLISVSEVLQENQTLKTLLCNL